MKENARNYSGKDVDMLITAETITGTAIANKAKLIAKRSSWADPYFDDLKAKIALVFQTQFGVDGAKELRQSTQVLLGIQKNGLKDLAELKVQLMEDFKKDPARRTEILKQLGFTDHHKDAQGKDQEALISLLYKFKQNLRGLQAEIMGKGTDKNILETITGYADTLKNANVSQETFKSSKKSITAGTLASYNAIYDEVISVCKIAAKFFVEDAHLKEQFSFSKVQKALNHKPGNDDDKDAPQA